MGLRDGGDTGLASSFRARGKSWRPRRVYSARTSCTRTCRSGNRRRQSIRPVGAEMIASCKHAPASRGPPIPLYTPALAPATRFRPNPCCRQNPSNAECLPACGGEGHNPQWGVPGTGYAFPFPAPPFVIRPRHWRVNFVIFPRCLCCFFVKCEIPPPRLRPCSVILQGRHSGRPFTSPPSASLRLRSEFVIFSRAFSGQGRYKEFHEDTRQNERA